MSVYFWFEVTSMSLYFWFVVSSMTVQIFTFAVSSMSLFFAARLFVFCFLQPSDRLS